MVEENSFRALRRERLLELSRVICTQDLGVKPVGWEEIVTLHLLNSKGIKMKCEESLNQIKTGVIEHMNDDHSDANLVYAKALAGLPDALSA